MRQDTCSLWFHPRSFVENNVKYRIASSRAIAKYKHSQAFLLSELSFNPYHEFSREAKEIILLKYDIWFDFLCEVEQFLLVSHSETMTKDFIDFVISLSDERVEYYHETMISNEEVFERKFLSVWEEVHTEIYNLFKKNISELYNITTGEFFGKMTDLLINTMNHTLFEVHEIDILFFTDGPLQFNFDSLCCDYKDAYGKTLVSKKIDIYFQVRKTEKIIIKQYTDVGIPFGLTPLKSELEEIGIEYKVI